MVYKTSLAQCSRRLSLSPANQCMVGKWNKVVTQYIVVWRRGGHPYGRKGPKKKKKITTYKTVCVEYNKYEYAVHARLFN